MTVVMISEWHIREDYERYSFETQERVVTRHGKIVFNRRPKALAYRKPTALGSGCDVQRGQP